jgi:hypothetical protein
MKERVLQQTPMKFRRLLNNIGKLIFQETGDQEEIENFWTHVTHQN